MAFSDRELLARLIQCEAGGEGENGMKAVAGVVMNRVHAKGGEYARVGQGSIRKIIFQPYQFVCASETEGGAYNPQNIYNMRPEQIHYDIADWAIAGNRLPDVAESLWFYNPFGPTCRSFFRRMWDTGRRASATIASTIRRMLITRLERCQYGSFSGYVYAGGTPDAGLEHRDHSARPAPPPGHGGDGGKPEQHRDDRSNDGHASRTVRYAE